MKRKSESRNAKSLLSKTTNGILVVLISVSLIFLSGCLWNRTTSHVSCLGYSSEITGFHIWKTERRSAVYIPDFFYIEYFSWPRRGFMPLLGEFLLTRLSKKKRETPAMLEFPVFLTVMCLFFHYITVLPPRWSCRLFWVVAGQAVANRVATARARRRPSARHSAAS